MKEFVGLSTIPSVPYARYYPLDYREKEPIYLFISRSKNGKLKWKSFLYTLGNSFVKSGSYVNLDLKTTGYSGNITTMYRSIYRACVKWNETHKDGPKFYVHKKCDYIRIIKLERFSY